MNAQPDLFTPAPDSVPSPRFRAERTQNEQKPRRTSKKSQDGDRMAEMFRACPNQRVSALDLEDGYGLRWRTTVSDLRFPPYEMDIQWKPEPYRNLRGQRKLKSFYVFVPTVSAREGE